MLHMTLAQGLPVAIVKRRKTGFTVPTWQWLRHHPGLDVWKRIPMLKQAATMISAAGHIRCWHAMPL